VKKKSHSRRQTKEDKVHPSPPLPPPQCVCVCVRAQEASMERNGAKSTNGSSHTKSKRRIIDPQHDPAIFLRSLALVSSPLTHLARFFLVCCKSQVPIYAYGSKWFTRSLSRTKGKLQRERAKYTLQYSFVQQPCRQQALHYSFCATYSSKGGIKR
jgi:hypothetical protein